MTFSVLARCARTGRMGVAVASHAVAVGAVVPWGRAGVGVAATQSVPVAEHGTRLVGMLGYGTAPADALRRVLAGDGEAGVRQIGVLDHRGRTGGWTGPDCVPFAGWCAADGALAQGNMLAADGTWTAMLDRVTGSDDELPARLLAALEAGEDNGGDIRGRQSAALLVVDGEPGGGVVVDVRVDDHPDPLPELRRLAALQQADHVMRAALRDAFAGGDLGRVTAELHTAQQVFGEANREPDFWAGVAAALAGRPDPAALADLGRCHPGWAELHHRVVGR